jgi:alpha-D-xyloside xylohydrolase
LATRVQLFTKHKLRLMPYPFQAGIQAHESGTPVMRPMAMEFPDDRNATYLDTQYMLGLDLLIAPSSPPAGQ